MKGLLLTLALLRGADGATTATALHAGIGAEGNQLLPHAAWAIVGVEAGIGITQDRAMRTFAKSHPTAAKAIVFASIGLEGFAVVNNSRVLLQAKR
jgi:hypothetical protein